MKDPLEPAGPQVAEPTAPRRSTAILAAVVALAAVVFVVRPSMRVTLAMIVGIGMLIMLHELGHFVAAKRCGMKVTEFFVGFGPRLWSVKRGETEYGIKAFVLGGYCRVIGMHNLEEVPTEDEPRAYRSASTPKKLVMVLAGVTVNFLLVLVLMFPMLWREGVVVMHHGQPVGTTTLQAVLGGTPAAAAGLRAGDRIVAIDGTPITSWSQIPSIVQDNPGNQLRFALERDGRSLVVPVVPERCGNTSLCASDPETGFLGVSPGNEVRHLGPVGAARESVVLLWSGTKASVNAITHFFSPSGVRQQVNDVTRTNHGNANSGGGADLNRPVTVIGLVSMGSQITGGDLWQVLGLLATLSLFLALFNLIPLLPFDGGHAAIAIYEAIASRVAGRKVRVDYRAMVPVAAVVLLALVVIVAPALFLDLRQIITGS